MHIFALPDTFPQPETTEGFTFIGRMTLQAPMAARGLWAGAEAKQVVIPPFEDTRLSRKRVTELHKLAVKNIANKDLARILEKAMQRDSGLISFVN